MSEKVKTPYKIKNQSVYLWAPVALDKPTRDRLESYLPKFLNAPSLYPFASGIKACDEIYRELVDCCIIDTYEYEKKCRKLRKSFPHFIVGEGKGLYHYYLIDDFKQWIEEEFA